MLWLELTKNPLHGGSGWEFGTCLWSPNAKADGSRWPFWSGLLDVREADSVAHLRHNGHGWDFVGTSIAASNGFITDERPPKPEESGFATRFNRVDLNSYQPFSKPIPLAVVFEENEDSLGAYFLANKARPKRERKHIFFVIQSKRLQCLNGAYLSEVDDDLASILFGADYSRNAADRKVSVIDIPTGEALRTLKIRVGQRDFSIAVRDNYNHRCCFPDCSVTDDQFLVGAHIARWADEKDLRGNPANGLCLCLMHDKAFEAGLCALDNDFKIIISANASDASSWTAANVSPFVGRQIRLATQPPSQKAIQLHRARHGIHT